MGNIAMTQSDFVNSLLPGAVGTLESVYLVGWSPAKLPCLLSTFSSLRILEMRSCDSRSVSIHTLQPFLYNYELQIGNKRPDFWRSNASAFSVEIQIVELI